MYVNKYNPFYDTLSLRKKRNGAKLAAHLGGLLLIYALFWIISCNILDNRLKYWGRKYMMEGIQENEFYTFTCPYRVQFT